MVKQRLGWYISSFLLLLCYGAASMAAASFSIAPERIYFNINHPATNTLIVRNDGDELIHLRLTATFFPIESHALHAGYSLDKNNEKKTSIAPYLLISPQVVSLHPGEQRYVRVSLHAPKNLPQGSYRAHVLAKMLEIYHHVHTKIPMTQLGVNLNLLMEIAVAVNADKGKNQAEIQLSCKRQAHKLMLVLTNTSVWNYVAKLDLKDRSRIFTVYRQSKLPINISDSAEFLKASLVTRNKQGTAVSFAQLCKHNKNRS